MQLADDLLELERDTSGDELPDLYLAPTSTLDRAVRQCAWRTAPGGDHPAWSQVVREMPTFDLGSVEGAGLVTRSGMYAAHLIRMYGAERETLWGSLLEGDGALVLNSLNPVTRRRKASQIRTHFIYGPDEREAAELIVKWLDISDATQPSDWLRPIIPITGHLARWVPSHLTGPYDPQLAKAWYCVHGMDLLGLLTVGVEPAGRGKPSAEQAEHLAAVRAAAVGTYATGLYTKTDIAALAQVTRRTLDAWINADPADTSAR